MSRRSDSLLLADMRESVDRILRYTREKSLEQWMADEQLQDAVVRNFEIIGEASRHLSHELLKADPDIDWDSIRDFRNLLVHEYFGVDLSIVWEIILGDLPKLKAKLATLRSGS